jgi:hypothetical protein
MTIVYCAHCGKELERKPAQIRRNASGLYFYDNVERCLYEKMSGIRKGVQQHRGWRRRAAAL